MKDENLKTLVNIIGVLSIVFNVIALIPFLSFLSPDLSSNASEMFKSIDIVASLFISILFVISGVGLIKKQKWSPTLYFTSTILLTVEYILSNLPGIFFFLISPLYLIVAILIIGSAIYIFKKRKIIPELKNESNDTARKEKKWGVSKIKFVFLYFLSNLLTWGALAIYIIYGLTADRFPGEAFLVAIFLTTIAFTLLIVVNAVLLVAYNQRNRRFFYVAAIVSIIVGILLTLVPMSIEILKGGSLYPN